MYFNMITGLKIKKAYKINLYYYKI